MFRAFLKRARTDTARIDTRAAGKRETRGKEEKEVKNVTFW